MSAIKPRQVNAALFATTAAAAVLLAGCGRADEDHSVRQAVGAAVVSAEQKTQSARSEIRQEVDQAREDATETSANLKQRAATAAETVADKVQDATITASVNAELARDADLSALKIDVDTVDGKVMLQGTAPSSEARERASRLAANVQGVTSVENRLEVRS